MAAFALLLADMPIIAMNALAAIIGLIRRAIAMLLFGRAACALPLLFRPLTAVRFGPFRWLNHG